MVMRPWAISAEDLASVDEYYPEQHDAGVKTLYTFYYNSFYVPSMLSYTILATFSLCVFLVILAPVLKPLKRLSFVRVLLRFANSPLGREKHAAPLVIIQGGRSFAHNPVLSIQAGLRWQSIAVGAWIIANILVMVAFYTPNNDNVYWPDSKYEQVLRYVSDRSGVLAMPHMFLCYLLAGRNSPVAILTRGHISFDSLMYFHRWVARMFTVLAFIHSLGYSLGSLAYGAESYKELFEPYVQWGVAAMVVLPLLCTLSLRFLRQASYEVFYVIHILLAIAAVITVYYHIALIDAESFYEYIVYIYATIAVWSLERFFRVVRLLILNINRPTATSPALTKAELVTLPSEFAPLIEKAEVASVEQPPLVLRIFPTGITASRVAKWAPGQHTYLAIPGWQPWTSHPFTVISAGLTAPALSRRETGNSTPTEEKSDGKHDDDTSSHQARVVSRPYVDLALRPLDGITKKLASWAAQDGSANLTVLLDGPYGPKLEFDHPYVQLIAGGIGVTYTLPFLVQAMERYAAYIPQAATSMDVAEKQSQRPVSMLWAVKTPATVAIAIPYLDAAVQAIRSARESSSSSNAPYASFSISIHVTQVDPAPNSTKEDPSLNAIRGALDELAPELSISWSTGRPDLLKAVRDAADAAPATPAGAPVLAVVACGPAAICDAARSAARHARKDGIEYYEESFAW